MSNEVDLEPFIQHRYEDWWRMRGSDRVNVYETLVRQEDARAYRKYLTKDNLNLCSGGHCV
jgi:hypothetical protein